MHFLVLFFCLFLHRLAVRISLPFQIFPDRYKINQPRSQVLSPPRREMTPSLRALSIHEKKPEISVVAKVEFPIGKKLFHLVVNPGTWRDARPWTWNW